MPRRSLFFSGLCVSLTALGLCALAACRQTPAGNAETPAGQSAAVAPAASGAVTYTKDIAPILFEHCASCHRPVDSQALAQNPEDPLCIAGAPFALLDYVSASSRAAQIAEVTATRAMPPWLPEPGHGSFANERRLQDKEIALIQQWVEQGAPLGDPADMPPQPAFPEGWQLGTPDLVVTSPESYTLRPGSGDVFRNFVVPVPRAPTRYVRAIEFRANNPTVLHHANIGVDPARISRALDRADRGPGFATMPDDDQVRNVYGWSPGKLPVLEPEDTAWPLEEGSDLVVQLHMVPGATTETVQPSIGLFFSSSPPTRVPIVVKLESKAIDIPAGESRYVIEDSYQLPADVDVVSVYPHAHYLAKEMRGTATLPDGTELPLIWIKQWDIRWQDQYRYREPLHLPRGTTLRMRFTYDNSAGNPNNPHRPPEHVIWGPRSTDEMGALWVEVIPRRPQDAAVLTQDYFRRARLAEVGRAELQVRTKPDDAAAHNLLAMSYLQVGRVQDAQAELERALRLDAGDAEAHSNLGTVLQLQGRLAEAEQHLRTAARLEPDDDRIRFNLGNWLHASGRVNEAVEEYRRALSLNPENADAHFNLAVLVGPQGRLAEATTHLQRVIEINPRNAEAYRNLSVALGMQGRLEEAIAQAQAAVRIQPDSTAAKQQLDRLLAARGR